LVSDCNELDNDLGKGHRKSQGELWLLFIELFKRLDSKTYMLIKKLNGCGHRTEWQDTPDSEHYHEDVDEVALIRNIFILLFLW
jgi:hypothetical protein